MSKIIDVSSNNGIIKWDRVKASGVTDAVVRLSLGYNTRDRQSEVNAREAAAAGIRVSYYHFAYPDKRTGTVEGDARQEAGYFVDLVKSGPAPRWLTVDLEEWENKRDSPLTPAEYYQWLTVFLKVVYDATGMVCIIYSYASYLNSHLPAGHALGSFPLWIANYNQVAVPQLPFGWKQYFMWQYSAIGTVPGIVTKCDLNILPAELFFKQNPA